VLLLVPALAVPALLVPVLLLVPALLVPALLVPALLVPVLLLVRVAVVPRFGPVDAGAVRARPRLGVLTMALKSAPARNLGTEVFGTLTVAPVAGLRAVRAARTCFSNTPNPVMETLSPLATVSWMVSSTALTASAAVLLSPIRPETASIRSRLFILSPSGLRPRRSHFHIEGSWRSPARALPEMPPGDARQLARQHLRP
jgi:hypothetical protein